MAYANDYCEEETGKALSVFLLLVMMAISAGICAYGFIYVLPKDQPPTIRFSLPETVIPFVPEPVITSEPAKEAPSA